MKFLLLSILAVGMVRADPVIVWSGTFTDTFDIGQAAPSITLTDTRVASSQNAMDFDGLYQTYTVDTNFTVTVAGEFLFSSIAFLSNSGSSCNPTGCHPVDNEFFPFAINYSAQAAITGPAAFSESLSDSGSTPYTCGDPDICFASLGLNNGTSEIVDLATGNYTLALKFAGEGTSIGDNFGQGGITTNIVATPEPGTLWIVLAGIAIMAFGRVRRLTDYSGPQPSTTAHASVCWGTESQDSSARPLQCVTQRAQPDG